MTITAPINVDSQHDDIEIFADDLQVVSDVAPASPSMAVAPDRDPLVPFLLLGIINLLVLLLTATLLAF